MPGDGLLRALREVEAALEAFHAAYLAWSEAGDAPPSERARLLSAAESRLVVARERLVALEAALHEASL